MGVRRVVAQGWENCQREAWILQFALSKGISVPEVWRSQQYAHQALLLLEYLPGPTLDRWMQGHSGTQPFEWLGEQLARIQFG